MDSGSGVVWRILRNFLKYHFCETPANGCFSILPDQYKPGEKFACMQFFAYSFDLIMSEV